MVDQRTMKKLLRAPTEGYAEAIVVPPILADQFELKHSLTNMMTSDQFFKLEKDNPHDHIRWFNKITLTIKHKDVPNSAIKLMIFPSSLVGAARRWLKKEPPCFILTWEDLVSKFINEFFPSSRMTTDQFFGLEKDNPYDHIRWFNKITSTIKYKDVPNYAIKLMLFPLSLSQGQPAVKSCDANSNSSSEIAKLTHAVNQQTSAVTTAITAILKQFQATPLPASVKAVEETCVTYGGAHPYYQYLAAGGNTFPEYRDNIQGYVSAAAVNYNQGNSVYRPPGMANQIRPPGFAQSNVQNNQNRKVKRINEANMKAMQTQINMVKNELRNEMKNSIQASLSNKTNEIKNMMAGLLQMNTASTLGSGSLPRNTVSNPKGKLKAITTQSGRVLDGPTVPTPPPIINPDVDERVEETLLASLFSEAGVIHVFETYKNVMQEIKDQLNAEAEAVQIILTGIDNDIYSTVDACPNACEMWKAIERLKQGESMNVQDLETNLFWEFGKFTSLDGESLESYYSRFYKLMNELTRNQCKVTNHQVNVQFLLQLQPEW
nr:reverse transcriptase domain-containing protein [Tanacetum cinerariifolium]